MTEGAPTTPAAPSPPANGFRTFLVLWSTQTLSLFGSFVSMFGVNIWLTRELYPDPSQRGALALGLTATAIATTAPLIFMMPLAGAYADRHDKRRTMLMANVVNALLSFLLVAMLATDTLGLWPAVLILAGYSVSGAFHSASFDSSYGLLVPRDQLQRANGMMQTSYGLSQLLAPALAAALIATPALARNAGPALGWLGTFDNGVLFTFLADGVSFLIAALAISAIRLPQPVRIGPPPTHSLWMDVREGLEWILHRRPFVWLISFGSLVNLTFAPLILLLPLLVRDRMGADLTARGMSFEAALALVNTAGGLGGVIGGIAISVTGGIRTHRTYVIVGAMIVLGLGEVIAGLSTTVWMCAVGMFVGELFVPMLNSTSYALWQTLTPPEMLGRALSSRRFISQSFFPLGTMVAGWLAVPIEPWLVVTLSGIALALVCAVQLMNPRFAQLEARMREAAAR